MEERTSGAPLLFEARDDAAALLRDRASMSKENIEVWEGMRRVTAPKLPKWRQARFTGKLCRQSDRAVCHSSTIPRWSASL